MLNMFLRLVKSELECPQIVVLFKVYSGTCSSYQHFMAIWSATRHFTRFMIAMHRISTNTANIKLLYAVLLFG